MSTILSNVMYTHNNKEDVVIAATITEDGTYINSRSVSQKIEDLVFSSPEALIWAFEEIARKDAEYTLAMEESEANRQAAIEAALNKKEFSKMLREWRNPVDSAFEGPSLGCDKTMRRLLNIQFRQEMSIFSAEMKALDVAEKEAIREGNRVFTQTKQKEALNKVMAQAKAKKEERQAAHQRKEAKMRARKIDGVTPKQITRKRKNKMAKVQVKKAQAYAWVKAIICVHNEQVRQGKLIQRKENKKEAMSMHKSWDYKAALTVEDQNHRQGARMRLLVTSLMTNKEVK